MRPWVGPTHRLPTLKAEAVTALPEDPRCWHGDQHEPSADCSWRQVGRSASSTVVRALLSSHRRRPMFLVLAFVLASPYLPPPSTVMPKLWSQPEIPQALGTSFTAEEMWWCAVITYHTVEMLLEDRGLEWPTEANLGSICFPDALRGSVDSEAMNFVWHRSHHRKSIRQPGEGHRHGHINTPPSNVLGNFECLIHFGGTDSGPRQVGFH